MLKNRIFRVAVKPPQNEEGEPERTCRIRWNDMPSAVVPLLESQLPEVEKEESSLKPAASILANREGSIALARPFRRLSENNS